MKRLCFLTVAQGPYLDYVPLYLYSIHRAYPEAGAIVFTRGKVETGLELVESDRLRVVEGEFDGYVDDGRAAAMWRFLLFTPRRVEAYLSGYDYFLASEIDFIICPEEPSLVEQRLAHCRTIGLPYTAYMRAYEPKIVAAGLFATREYVEQVGRVTTAFDKLVRQYGEDIFAGNVRHADERLQYLIIARSGLPEPPQLRPYSREAEFKLLDPSNYTERLFRPHHGIHLGIFRHPNLRRDWGELLETDFYQAYFAHVRRLAQEPVCRELVSRLPRKRLAGLTVRKMLEVAKSYA